MCSTFDKLLIFVVFHVVTITVVKADSSQLVTVAPNDSKCFTTC